MGKLEQGRRATKRYKEAVGRLPWKDRLHLEAGTDVAKFSLVVVVGAILYKVFGGLMKRSERPKKGIPGF